MPKMTAMARRLPRIDVPEGAVSVYRLTSGVARRVAAAVNPGRKAANGSLAAGRPDHRSNIDNNQMQTGVPESVNHAVAEGIRTA
jgi:hypothetical protein